MKLPFNNDRGSAVVEFVLVAPLLMGIALAVIQVALALHVRTTLISAAAEGARAAAMAGSSQQLGEQRARAVLDGNIASSVIEGIDVGSLSEAGVQYAEVAIRARLPLIGLLGPGVLNVHGRAIQEHV